jgi:hypothetical protein
MTPDGLITPKMGDFLQETTPKRVKKQAILPPKCANAL